MSFKKKTSFDKLLSSHSYVFIKSKSYIFLNGSSNLEGVSILTGPPFFSHCFKENPLRVHFKAVESRYLQLCHVCRLTKFRLPLVGCRKREGLRSLNATLPHFCLEWKFWTLTSCMFKVCFHSCLFYKIILKFSGYFLPQKDLMNTIKFNNEHQLSKSKCCT